MDGDDLSLRTETGDAIGAGDLYAVLRLRAEVFVVEQACPYLDPDGRDLEPTTVHRWLADPSGAVAAYLRVLREPDGTWRVGRVVTGLGQRGRRLSARLLDATVAELDRPVVLDAQSHLTALYERHGFAVDGPSFVEDGIPHTPMRLT